MRKALLIAVVGAVALLVVGTSVAVAGNENGNKLSCFSGTQDGGYNGTCGFTGSAATLNNVDSGAPRGGVAATRLERW
jgi:hypothetical protein